MGKRTFEEGPGKDRSPKKRFSGDGGDSKDRTGPSKLQKPSAPSVTFDKEEADFPRGGASALTLAEIRNIRSQAEAEFDSEISKSSKTKGKQGKRRLSKSETGDDQDEASLFGVGLTGNFGVGLTGNFPKSAEVVRHKILSVGMKIWGAVAEVNNGDLVINLPGGLRGFVHAEEASDMVADILKGVKKKKNEIKKKLKAKEDKARTQGKTSEETVLSDEDESDEETSEFSLKELFEEQQLVACTIISLDKGKGFKKGKRIGLSLRLSRLNEGLTLDGLREGSPVTACVSSVEDHGYLLSLGVAGLSGFLLHQNCQAAKLKKGQLVSGVVVSADKKRGTVNLKADHKMLAAAMVQEHDGLSIEQLLPGSLVSARVRAVLRDGLLLSFLTYFTGTVDIFHLDVPLVGSKWAEGFAVNQKLKARILYVDPVTKSVGLTVNSSLVHNSVPSWAVQIGDAFTDAVVRRVDQTLGLLIELPSKPSPSAAYVHISNVSDGHIDKLEKKFTEGRRVKARVIGYRIMDGLAIASLKTSVLQQMIVSLADVRPGMPVNATVVAVEPFGAIAQIGEALKGLCPLQHMSEFQRSTPSPKFQVGVNLKFRVVSVDQQSKKITLTHKKTLVSSKLTPITSYEDAVEGLITHGWITGIEDYGCFVSFYNDVKGLVHRTEMGLPPGASAGTAFQLGQVVKCRVLRSDPSTRRLAVSFSMSSRAEHDIEAAELSVGSIVSGVVAQAKEKSFFVDVELGKSVAKGVLAYSQLSDNIGHTEQLKALIKPGYKFDQLLIVEKRERKLILSTKFSLLQAAASLPSDVSQLQADSVLQGYIANVNSNGCFVRFLGRLTGLATLREVADTFVPDPSQMFIFGQSVRAKVTEVKEEKGKFYLSLKQSLCFSTDASLLQSYFLEEEKISQLQAEASGQSSLEWSKDLAIGGYVDGEIQDVKDYGVIMNLFDHQDIVGFIAHYQVGGTAVVGAKFKARVLDIVKSDGIVDLSLRQEIFSPEDLEKTSSDVKKTSTKKRKSSDKSNMLLGQKAAAVVELVKDEYLVLSLPDHGNSIGFASTRDYNIREEDPHKQFQPGQRLSVSIQVLPDDSTGGRLLLLLNKSSKAAEMASPKKPRRQFRHEVGELVEGEIVSIDSTKVNVDLARNVKGSVHITEVWDDFQEGNPFAQFKVGQNITARVLTKVKSTANPEETLLDLSVRPSEISGDKVSLVGRPLFETVKVGQMLTAYVQVVEDDKAWLLVGPHLRGRLHVLDSSDEPSELRRFRERLKVGQAVRCWVLGKDLLKGTLDLSLREVNTAAETPDKEPHLTLEKGSVLGGKVTKVYPGVGGLVVQVSSKLYGKVHVTHLSDVWVDDPGKKFEVGQFVKCVVLDVNVAADGKTRIDLSLRASLGGYGGDIADTDENISSNTDEGAAVVEELQDISPGQLVQAFVKSASSKGCFVVLSRSVEGRILIKDLADTFLQDPAESFPPGKLVTGRITKVERLSGRVEMSLRKAPSKTDDEEDEEQLEDLQVGDIKTCKIKKIVEYGLFLTIDKSQIVGLCHISEVADTFTKDLSSAYRVGQKVRAKILKIDKEKKRISFGLKESYLASPSEGGKGYDSASEDAIDEEMDSEEEDGQTPGDHIEEDDGKEDDDLEALAAMASEKARSKGSVGVPALQVDLDLESGDEEGGERNGKEEVTEQDDEGSEKQKKRAKKRERKEREAEIAAAEEKRLKDQGAPETIDEFEQLVRGSPNSSFVWIKYMAFMLSMAEVDKARAIADRALQTINFREESEKMNVWIAYLNLENAYGNPKKEAVLQLFQKALQYCEPKKMYLALLNIYERTEQEDMADELLKTMTRKFKGSAKIWLRFIQRGLKKGSAGKALEQSLLSLPKRKHLKVITQASIMEFKQGSPERGRAIFEGIVRNYPKRLDLWNVYLDQEIRVGDVDIIRALFERVVTLELQAKKMKSLFKRYLDFEKSQGDPERMEYVKAKAMEYVETKLG
ncbi:hypothetical protein R1sor_002922 [Riccia sorocarpa]|uniref:S1 motif domain-containing protein n=1 Tax=Riccia sorocarpa TaxID=122646 RepID=A0ABD3H039_9MARC